MKVQSSVITDIFVLFGHNVKALNKDIEPLVLRFSQSFKPLFAKILAYCLEEVL